MDIYILSISLVIVLVIFIRLTGNLIGFSVGSDMKMKVSDLSLKEQKDIISYVIKTLSEQANIKEPQWMVGNIKGMDDITIGLFDPEINKIFIDVDRMSNEPLNILFTTTST